MLYRRFLLVMFFAICPLAWTVVQDVLGVDSGSTKCLAAETEKTWNHEVIYFMLTDRFHDGDTSNNIPHNSDPELFDEDQEDISRYHGGDFRGIEKAIKDGYFKDLGITAIWITPPVKNTWFSKRDMESATRPGKPWSYEKTGYHGYWAQDFLDVDPHLTSSTNNAGETSYSNDREGRIKHYRDLVKLAHSHNIKVIQDIVCNHVGTVFYYDDNNNGKFDLAFDLTNKNEKEKHSLNRNEWIQPYLALGNYENSRWADIPEWNLVKTAPNQLVTLLGKQIPVNRILGSLDTYGRKGWSVKSFENPNDEEVMCDFVANRDIWTAPNSPFFNDLVDEFVTIYDFYIQEIGVDGLRVDSVKHAHHGFWDGFTKRLRKRLGAEAKNFIIFGEVYDWQPKELGQYTFRSTPPNNEPCLDSVLNFQFCNAVRNYLRCPDSEFGPAELLEDTIKSMNGPYYNTQPGLDGLCAKQKLVNFIGNHDGLNRFLVKNVGDANHRLALGLAMTWEGIPCIYYGSEAGMRDNQAEVSNDSETGRTTFWPRDNESRLRESRATPTFQSVASLAKYRSSLPALSKGQISPLWMHNNDKSRADSGVFAFCRYLKNKDDSIKTDDSVVVVVNAHPDKTRTAGLQDNPMTLATDEGKPLLSPGDRLVRLPVAGQDEADSPTEPIAVEWKDGRPFAVLSVAPKTINLYRVIQNDSPYRAVR